jgi:DNA-binding GntR family transcriptional regulator
MKSPTSGNKPRQTLRNAAYHAFIDHLFSGDIRPGSMVSQRELCEILDIPLNPMREALKRLEAENFVKLIPQRGIQIFGVEEEFLAEAFQLRKLLEVEGLRTFFAQGKTQTAQDLFNRTKAASDGDEGRQLSDFQKISECADLDHEMHLMFIGALNNNIVNDMMTRILSKLRLSRLIFRLHNYHDIRAFQEHVAILEKVLADDEDGAVQALSDHLDKSKARIMGIA